MVKTFTLLEMQQLHKIECQQVSFEYFMDAYCNNILVNSKFKRVEVIVSKTFKFEFALG